MDTQHPLQMKEELVEVMRQLGWSLSGIVAAPEYSTFAFANEHAGDDEINTLSIVGYGRNATEDERFADAVRRFLDEHPESSSRVPRTPSQGA